MGSKIISDNQFSSFIDRKLPESPKNALEVTGSTFIGKIMERTEQDFRNLIELAKYASREQNSEMADLFYELKELKEKEIGVIYNYITNHR